MKKKVKNIRNLGLHSPRHGVFPDLSPTQNVVDDDNCKNPGFDLKHCPSSIAGAVINVGYSETLPVCVIPHPKKII